MAVGLGLVAGRGLAVESAPRRMLVLPLQAKAGVPRARVEALDVFLTTEARRVPGYAVLSTGDLERMLTLEQQRQMVGCQESSCLAEVAGALNAEEVLAGTVGRLGARELVLTLTRVEPRTARALAGESERLAVDDTDAALDAAARALQRLYPAYVLPSPRVQGLGTARTTAAMLGVGAAMQYAATATAFFSLSGLLFFGPMGGAPLVVPAMATCVMSPWVTAWAQAWAMDLLGRRQGGFRKAALLGSLLVPAVMVAAVPVVLAAGFLGGTTGTAAGVSAGVLMAAANAPAGVDDAWVHGVMAGVLGVTQVAGAGLLCTGLAMVPAILLVSVGVPLVQAVLLVWDPSHGPRPPGEEARVPGLWGPQEVPPKLPALVPSWLVGGATHPEEDLDPESVEDPAALTTAPGPP
jgi:hypothetical protein